MGFVIDIHGTLNVHRTGRRVYSLRVLNKRSPWETQRKFVLIRRETAYLKCTYGVSKARENKTIRRELFVNRCDPYLECGQEVRSRTRRCCET